METCGDEAFKGDGVILTDPSPKATNKRTIQYKHFCFTFNNYENGDINILIKLFNEICYMYAFQEETGKNGTPHLQGVISLHHRARYNEFGLNKKIHWEKVKDLTASYIYCTKIETRTGKVYTKNYDIPIPLKIINKNSFYKWQHDIINIIVEEPNDRTVNWFWSLEGGIGKSSFVKYLIVNHNAIVANSGKYADICNLIYKTDMNKSNLVIFDLPRNNGNKISYSVLESIKNGVIVNTKYETGSKVFNPPHILVFSNVPPDIDKLSSDRWHIVQL